MNDKLFIIEDDADLRHTLQTVLADSGLAADGAATAAEALQTLSNRRYQLIILDLTLPDMDGLELLRRLHRDYPRRIIVFTGTGTVMGAVEAMKLGVFDFIEKPAKPEQLLLSVRNALEMARLSGEIAELKSKLGDETRFDDIIHSSRLMHEAIERASLAARSEATVLITGETGTGKDLFSRAIHHASPRGRAPFIAVNCATIPYHLAESELFGHARGAFTDANRAYTGRLQQADGGTLFLDEISELPTPVQAKLLRFLEDRIITPLGSERSSRLDIRIIAASNLDLDRLAARREFRADLLHRLRQVSIEVPPLRRRPDDIPVLVGHFIRLGNLTHSRQVTGCEPKAMSLLRRHGWPGNVRELKHLIQEFFVVSVSPRIDSRFVGLRLHTRADSLASREKSARLSAVEREHIEAIYHKCGDHAERAARTLGISRATLYRRLAEYRKPRSVQRKKSR
jgi:DNA-binding NtrC family response regulator